jgi:endonuclease YncB( thermonuclease family)
MIDALILSDWLDMIPPRLVFENNDMNRHSAAWFLFFLLSLGCEQEKTSVKTASSFPPTAYIRRVEDGDTVLADVGQQIVLVRLMGIDSPETAGRNITKAQPYAQEAKEFLKRQIEKKWVTIRERGKDRHGRLLATLYLDGEDINLKMVAVGLAEVYTGFSQPEYREAEKRAKAQKLNIWLSPDRLSPREWRKRYKNEPRP